VKIPAFSADADFADVAVFFLEVAHRESGVGRKAAAVPVTWVARSSGSHSRRPHIGRALKRTPNRGARFR